MFVRRFGAENWRFHGALWGSGVLFYTWFLFSYDV